MADKTTYIVESKYVVTDHASGALHNIGHAAHGAHEHAEGLKDTLKEVGEAFLLFEGVEKAKELFIGLNSSLEQARIQMTSVLGANFKKPWAEAKEAAGEMYEEFEGFAEKFPTSVGELSTSMKTLSVAVGAAGGNMEDLKTITEGSVVAAKTMGIEATTMYRALEGNISKRSAGGMALLNMIGGGMTAEKWKKLTADSRMHLIETAMKSDTMKSAQSEMANSFGGQTTILKDRLEMLASGAGLPLFKALTKEIQSWNEWLDKNKQKVEEIAHRVSEGLMTGFGYLKSVMSFLYDHSGVLIDVAKAWAAVKIGSAVGGIVTSGVGSITKMMDGIGKFGGFSHGAGDKFNKETGAYEFHGASKGMGAKDVLGNLGSIMGAAGAGYAIGTWIRDVTGMGEAIHEWIDPAGVRFEKLAKSMEMFDESVRHSVEEQSKLGGALGTHAAGLLQGNIDVDARKIATLSKIEAGKYAGAKTVAWEKQQKSLLEGAGFDPAEVDSLLGNKHTRGSMMANLMRGNIIREQHLGGSSGGTQAGLMIWSLKHLGDKTTEHVNIAKAQQAIMQAQLQMLAGPEHRFLNQDDIDKVMKDKSLFDEQTKVNQTVNIHIEQVSAKDPDRWLADLDDYAARRVRSRTRAKSAPARGF